MKSNTSKIRSRYMEKRQSVTNNNSNSNNNNNNSTDKQTHENTNTTTNHESSSPKSPETSNLSNAARLAIAAHRTRSKLRARSFLEKRREKSYSDSQNSASKRSTLSSTPDVTSRLNIQSDSKTNVNHNRSISSITIQNSNFQRDKQSSSSPIKNNVDDKSSFIHNENDKEEKGSDNDEYDKNINNSLLSKASNDDNNITHTPMTKIKKQLNTDASMNHLSSVSQSISFSLDHSNLDQDDHPNQIINRKIDLTEVKPLAKYLSVKNDNEEVIQNNSLHQSNEISSKKNVKINDFVEKTTIDATYGKTPEPKEHSNKSNIPTTPSSPMRDIKNLLSSVMDVNRTYNTPHPPSMLTKNTNTLDHNSEQSIPASTLMKQRFHQNKQKYTPKSVLMNTQDFLPRTPSRESITNFNTNNNTSMIESNPHHPYDQDFFNGDNHTFGTDSSIEYTYVTDTLCIRYNSDILVKSHYVNGKEGIPSLKVEPQFAYTVENENDQGHSIIEDFITTPRFDASADGVGLGMEDEVFKIVDANSLTTTSTSAPSSSIYNRQNLLENNKLQRLVHYGDTVAFVSCMAYDRALGVRKYELPKDVAFAQHQYELGFFRSLLGQAEKWTIIWGGSTKDPIRIGPGIDDTLLGQSKEKVSRRPVRSGEAIVLKNHLTGGLLALNNEQFSDFSRKDFVSLSGFSLSLATLSTKSNEKELQSHPASANFNSIIPGSLDKWHIVPVNTPPCPNWINHNRGRVYLNSCYLLYPNRNEVNEDVKELFECTGHNFNHREDMPKSLANETLDMQEKILLDEVIGALMGLEGNHIKATSTIHENPSKLNHESGDLIEHSKHTHDFHEFGHIIEKEENLHQSSFLAQEAALHTIEFSFLHGNEPNSKIKVDPSLTHLVQQILPLATNYARVNAFVCSRRSRNENGLVVHALAAAMKTLLNEYLVFVCQMEHSLLQEELTMQKLWCFIQPSHRTMQVLSDVTKHLHQVKGGALLNELQNMQLSLYEGDENANNILEYLIEHATVPYMETLSLWIYTGQLHDPYGEFFIHLENKEKNKVLNGDNWNDFYNIRQDQILLTFYHAGDDIPGKILTAGKYLNAFHQCNQMSLISSKDQYKKLSEEISYKLGPLHIGERIQKSFNESASSLLNLIMEDNNLMKSLQSMKRYFLLNQGDFFVQFLDLAEDELLEEMSKVSKGRIQSLLALATQLGGSNDDSFRDVLKCDFATCSVVNHLDNIHARSGGIASHEARTPKRTAYGTHTELTGIEAFMLDYSARWPLSLVIPKKCVASYQLIFRHLFFSKHVERRLFETWLDHQIIKELNLRSILGPTYLLRQRMLHFMQNFVYYVMFEVIEPHWLNMKQKFKSSKTIDDVISAHNKFLAVTHEECLLKNRDLLKTLTKIMQTCLLFSDQMKRFAKSTKLDEENRKFAVEERRKRMVSWDKPKVMRASIASGKNDRRKRISMLTSRMQKAILSKNYQRMIQRFVQVFDTQINDFMKQLMVDSHEHYHSHLSNLCTRLDFNGFVTRTMKIS